AVPMLLTRGKPDHIAWPDFLDRATLALRPAQSRRNDQRLTEWMRMPGSARTRLESHAGATNTRRFGWLEQRINANSTGKPIGLSFGGTLRTRSFYFHLRSPIFSL